VRGSFRKSYPNYGPGGSTSFASRDGTYQDGQLKTVWGLISNDGTSTFNKAVYCEKIDNTKNIFDSLVSVDIQPVALAVGTDVVVEYGTGGVGGVGESWASDAAFAAGTCADSESPVWYTSASAVPGGKQFISKVRFRLLVPIEPTQIFNTYINLKATTPSQASGFGSPAGTLWPAETKVNNWLTGSLEYFDPASPPAPALGIVYAPGSVGGVSRTWIIPNSATAYNTTTGSAATVAFSDTALIAYSSARITKEVASQVSASNPSQVVAGNTIDYVLKPTLSAIVAAGSYPVKVTDILPPNTAYVAGSASIAPTTVQAGVPAAGYTTLTWDIPNVTPNSTIPPITFKAITSGTAPDATQIPNFTRISSPADPLPDCSAPAAGIYGTYTTTGTSTSGTLCANAARRDLAISAPPGFRVFKSTSKAATEPGAPFTNTVSWVGIGSTLNTVDIIDVFPYNGDGPANAAISHGGKTPATVITTPGTLALVPNALSVAGDASAKFYYTTAAPGTINRDANAPSNGALGAPSAMWTLCPANVCPATSTAIRYVSGSSTTAGVAREFTFTLDPNNVLATDQFNNTFTAAGSGLPTPVTSNPVVTVVALGSIAGKVFVDANNDGSVAATDAGIANVQVCLQGYSYGPNEVDNAGAGDDIAVPKTCKMTDSSGNYKFTDIYAGKYSVTQTRDPAISTGLAGKLDGKDTEGTLGGTATNGLGAADDTITGIVMPVGAAATGYNFGELLPASISGKSFNDVDSSGAYNASTDLPIPNHLITLKGLNDKGETVLMYACTDATGNYSFAAGGKVQTGGTAPICAGPLPADPTFLGLRPGSYSVDDSTPPATGYIDTTPTANLGTGATTAGVAATNQLASIVLNSGNPAIDYNFGDTIKKYNVTGTVFNDINGNTDGLVSATGTTNAGSTQLRAVIVGSDGKVVSSAVVQPDGTYSIPNVPPGTGYTVRLVDSATAPAFQSVAPAPSLPAGWVNTGEASAGSSGTVPDSAVDGIGAPIDVVAADVPNRNFGIEQPPVAGNSTIAQQPMPSGTNTAAVDSSAFTGISPPATVSGTYMSDPAPGAVTNVFFPSFPTNTTSITINGVKYVPTGATPGPGETAFPAAGITVTTAQLAGMALDPTDGPIGVPQSSVITYFPVDAAGVKSPTAGTVTMPFLYTGVKISGTVLNDVNGNTDTFVNGAGTNAATPALSAYLVDTATGKVVKTTPITAADGTYSFTGVPAGSYTVVLANKAPVAADIGAAPPAPSLPAGWVNTGEVIGNATTATSETAANTADGKSPAITVTTVDVPNVNFGIEQPPVAGNSTIAERPTPPGTTTATVDASAFTGVSPPATVTGTYMSDPSPGAVTSVSIPTFPTNTTSITINGVKYVPTGATPGPGETAFPAAGLTVPTAQLAGMVIDPIDGPVGVTTNSVITYFPIDAAGLKATTAGTVTVPFKSAGFNVSGNVYNDTNGNTDSKVNGTGTNAASSALSAYLVDTATGKVIKTAAINPADGTYSFAGVPVGSYTVVLANKTPVAADIGAAPPAPSLPAGWVNTGEVIGDTTTTTSETAANTADGKSPAITVTAADVANVNFGIEQPPTATATNPAPQPNPGGTTNTADLKAGFGAADPAATGSGITEYTFPTMPTNADSVTINGTTYYANPTGGQLGFPNGGVKVASLTSITVDPKDGALTVDIPYTVSDAAGKTASATVQVPFTQLTLSGNVFDDANGNKLKDDTAGAGGALTVPAGLSAVITDSTGKVMAVVPVDPATGNYTTPIGTGTYVVTVTNNPPAIGTTGPTTGPAATLPMNWQTTGENLAGAAEATPDSKQTVTVTTANITGVNFGMNQLPDTADKTAPTAPNPGGTAQVQVPLLTGTDPEDGPITNKFVVTKLPDPVTMGKLYYNGVEITAANQATTIITDPTKLTLDPIDGSVTAKFEVASIDAAGKQDPTPAVITMPFNQLVLNGNVFNDPNGSKTKDPAENTPVPAGMNAVVTDTTGKVIAVVPVDPTTGNYSTNIAPGNYVVTLTTASPVVGSTGPAAGPAVVLPSNYTNTGENLGGTIDATSDGKHTGIAVTTANITNVNFGIEQMPDTAPKTAATAPNPGGNVQVPVPLLTGTDPEDGAITNNFVITKLPDPATEGKLYYNGVEVTAANMATLKITDPSKLTVDPVDGSPVVKFEVAAVDAAGKQDPTPAVITVPFVQLNLKGNVFDDANGNKTKDTAETLPVPAGLSVVVTDATGKVVAVAAVDPATGNYTTPIVPGNYTTTLTTTPPAVGSTGPATGPAPTLPANWTTTGENNTGTPDATPDSKQPVVIGATQTTDTTGINFGIEQLPDTAPKTAATAPNPGGNVQVPVPALTGTDPEDGAITNNFVITKLPDPVTEGKLYYNGVEVTAANMATLKITDPSKLTVDPVDGSPVVKFEVAAVDAAGKQDPTPAVITVPFVQLNLKGNVFDDANGNKTKDTAETLPVPAGLSVVVTDATGKVVAVAAVDPATGNYTTPIVPGNYTTTLTTTPPAVGSTGPATGPAPTLPANWTTTGENNTGTPDATPDSKQPVVIGATQTTDTTGINFGIEQLPNTDDKTAAAAPNPGGTAQVPVPLLTGTDPEDGPVTKFVVTKIPDPATMGTLYYDGVPVTPGMIITDPSKLKLDPVDGAPIVKFEVAAIDAAGKQDPTPAVITVPFVQLNLKGNVFDDANGNKLKDDTAGAGGALTVPPGLSVVVTDETGKVVAVAAVDPATGNYTTPIVPGNYTTTLTTTPPV
jgi:hypothetical protein